MSPWIWLLVAIVIATAGFLWLGRRALYYRNLKLAALAPYIDSFLRTNDTGSVFMAERTPSPGFLQLAMGENAVLEQELVLGIPEVEWSGERFEHLVAVIQSHGYEHSVETSTGGAVRRFLRVSCRGVRPQLAQDAVRLLGITAKALGWTPDDTYSVHCEGSPGPQAWRGTLKQFEGAPNYRSVRLIRRYLGRQLGRRL